MTLSGARDFQFDGVSDLTAKISFLLKKATVKNNKMREIEHLAIAKNEWMIEFLNQKQKIL